MENPTNMDELGVSPIYMTCHHLDITGPVLMPTTCIGLGLVDGFTLTGCNNEDIGQDETAGKKK